MADYTTDGLYVIGPSKGVLPTDNGGDYAIADSKGQIIGEAFHHVGEGKYRPAEANAKLWAKAPQLVEALEGLLNGKEGARERARALLNEL